MNNKRIEFSVEMTKFFLFVGVFAIISAIHTNIYNYNIKYITFCFTNNKIIILDERFFLFLGYLILTVFMAYIPLLFYYYLQKKDFEKLGGYMYIAILIGVPTILMIIFVYQLIPIIRSSVSFQNIISLLIILLITGFLIWRIVKHLEFFTGKLDDLMPNKIITTALPNSTTTPQTIISGIIEEKNINNDGPESSNITETTEQVTISEEDKQPPEIVETQEENSATKIEKNFRFSGQGVIETLEKDGEQGYLTPADRELLWILGNVRFLVLEDIIYILKQKWATDDDFIMERVEFLCKYDYIGIENDRSKEKLYFLKEKGFEISLLPKRARSKKTDYGFINHEKYVGRAYIYLYYNYLPRCELLVFKNDIQARLGSRHKGILPDLLMIIHNQENDDVSIWAYEVEFSPNAAKIIQKGKAYANTEVKSITYFASEHQHKNIRTNTKKGLGSSTYRINVDFISLLELNKFSGIIDNLIY